MRVNYKRVIYVLVLFSFFGNLILYLFIIFRNFTIPKKIYNQVVEQVRSENKMMILSIFSQVAPTIASQIKSDLITNDFVRISANSSKNMEIKSDERRGEEGFDWAYAIFKVGGRLGATDGFKVAYEGSRWFNGAVIDWISKDYILLDDGSRIWNRQSQNAVRRAQ